MAAQQERREAWPQPRNRTWVVQVAVPQQARAGLVVPGHLQLRVAAAVLVAAVKQRFLLTTVAAQAASHKQRCSPVQPRRLLAALRLLDFVVQVAAVDQRPQQPRRQAATAASREAELEVEVRRSQEAQQVQAAQEGAVS